MPKKRSRIFSRAFKLAAVRRMIAGEDVGRRTQNQLQISNGNCTNDRSNADQESA